MTAIRTDVVKVIRRCDVCHVVFITTDRQEQFCSIACKLMERGLL